jgi:crotonobetainyl-CoA:carnitine CoA-transferase CaiB-like acyl-CoA transferase
VCGGRRSAVDRPARGGDDCASGHGDVSMLGSALHIDGAPLQVRTRVPALGRHTVNVLRDLRFSAVQVDQLRERGAV